MEKKTNTITLKKFPTNTDEKITVFLNFYNNCKKQASFTENPLPSLEEISKTGSLKRLTIPFSIVGDTDPKNYLFNNNLYMYAQIEGSSIPQPLPMILSNFRTKQEENMQITIGSVIYYEKITIFENANNITIMIGQSTFITIPKKEPNTFKMKYTQSKKIRTIVKDFEFFLAAISNGGFKLENTYLPIDKNCSSLKNVDMKEKKQQLVLLKKVIQMFDILGYNQDMDITTLNKKDWDNINTLVSTFVEKKTLTLQEQNLPEFVIFPIQNIEFLLYAKKINDAKGRYQFFDFFKIDYPLKCKNENGESFFTSQYALLREKELLKIANIQFEKLLPSFQKQEKNDDTINSAIGFLLQLLLAYDQNNEKKVILNTAKDFADWLISISDESFHDICLLNQLQTLKRFGPLNNTQIRQLYELIESSNQQEEILVGAYLLLDQQTPAEIHFSKLTEEEKTEFRKFPIYHFWKESNDIQ